MKEVTILVVDDDPTNLLLLFDYLKESGFKTLVATDGKKALRQAELTQPDLILLDIMMPVLDGFETCRRLKANENTREIPVIFITALSSIKDKIEGFEAGAVDYVTKPFQQEELLARVTTHITLRNLRRELQQEVAERRKAEEMLRQSNAELQARNLELDTFAHTVAHDLRNPLGLILGYSELLKEEAGLSEALQEQLSAIVWNGRKMYNIIDELLLLARVRNTEIELKPLNMAEIIAEVQQRLAYMIEEKQVEIIFPEDWPVVMGYAPWIEEVWANYLSNAVRYGGQPPRLQLGATVSSEGIVRFWVRDNGSGLTPKEQAQLFIPFTQLHKTRAEGHGLGLSIVQHIVEKLGGQVGVESQVGQGSTFYFTLQMAS